MSFLISSCVQFLYVTVIPKYLNLATFFKWFISYPYVLILPSILFTRHQVCFVLSAFTSRPNSLPATNNFCFSYSMFIFHNLEFWLWGKNFANFALNVTVVCKSCYPFKLTSDQNLWHLMNCSVKLAFSMWPLNVYNSQVKVISVYNHHIVKLYTSA